MRRFATPLTIPLVIAMLGIVAAAALIGYANQDYGQRAALGWALLGFVVVITLADPIRQAGVIAAIISVLAFAAASAAQLNFDKKAINADNLDLKSLVITAIALIAIPFLLTVLIAEIKSVYERIRYQARVIDDLTVRDTETGAFKPMYIESILSEEIDRARRYHRSLTLAIISADDWQLVVEDSGEANARALATRIIEQLAHGTRSVDKIVQLGDGAFAIVLPETPLEGAEVLAARLQALVSSDSGIMLRVGLADFPRDAVTSDALIQEANEALTFARTADMLVVDRTLLGQGV